MKIGTGYFAQAKKYLAKGYAPVSIALKQPWFLKGQIRMWGYSPLAPTSAILSLKENPEEYTKSYQKEILGKQDPAIVFQHLKQIAKEAKKDNVVLLCWEGIGKFCHRHIVAKWLNANYGLGVKEVELNPQGEFSI